MALTSQSLFLYNFQITSYNSSIDFQIVNSGPVLQATIAQGYYSLTGLLNAIVTALQAADPTNTYTATANRNVSGGTQNRVTIATSGSFFSLLFLSGPRTASTVAPLIGFQTLDQTGAVSYTGNSSAGKVLAPSMVGYSYTDTNFYQKVFGSVNVSASGVKEAVVFNIQQFFEVQFKYISQSDWITNWTPFMVWAIQQREMDFTPNINSPNTFYTCTLESTPFDSQGLGFKGSEMRPDFPFAWDTGIMKFRVVVQSAIFLTGG
jgi:hypothetical protein